MARLGSHELQWDKGSFYKKKKGWGLQLPEMRDSGKTKIINVLMMPTTNVVDFLIAILMEFWVLLKSQNRKWKHQFS
jgi:hypothetical protein